jgi:glutamate-1-semialdehyde 2,1-aminomutase
MTNSKTLSETLFQRSLKVAPGGVHSPVRSAKGVGITPTFFESGEGAYLTSVEGERYVDFCMSFGPLILGHRDPVVQEAVMSQIYKAWTFGACEPYSLELAEWIIERLPHVEKLRFVSSGTEAVMSALRLARAATGRSTILKFHGCYHGHVDSMLVKAGSGVAELAESDSAGVGREVAQTTLVASLNDETGLQEMFALRGRDIAAVIIEPLPANYGLLPQTKQFLLKVQKLCQKNGSLLIFDEVISGFRMALGGMAELTGIKPDLVTYGKILGGGFPVGCYAGRADLLEMVAPQGPVYQAGTLSANPVGMVAGLATLKRILELDLYATLERLSHQWATNINKAWNQQGLPLCMTQRGSLFWVQTSGKESFETPQELPINLVPFYKKFFPALLNNNIYLAPSAYEVGFLSAAHTPELLESLAEKVIRIGAQAFEATV